MAKPFDFGSIHLSAGGDPSAAKPDAERPFCVAILGDFSGRRSRSQTDANIAKRRPVLVDRDNIDEVLGNLNVELRLPLNETSPLVLRFHRIDDFHPDRLLESCELFAKLRELRRRVQNPETFAAVAEELGLSAAVSPPSSRGVMATSAGAVARQVVQEGGSLLDQVIESADERGQDAARRRRPDHLQEFVRKVTAGSAVSAADPRQKEITQAIDRALSAQMRALLHVPDFQALEAAWRSLFFLVRRVETGPELKLYLFDIAQEEIATDLRSASDLRNTAVYKLLVENSVGTPGAEPFAAIVGNFTFGDSREDAYCLAQLATIAQRAGAPFLAGASPRLLGCASLAETPHPRDWRTPVDPETAAAWSAMRHLPQAAWAGLTLPRFLLRLPYGKETDPIESFDFEEMESEPSHGDYLWGNPAFACALLLAQSFSERGWDMRAGDRREIERLPLHVYQHEGESEVKACAETVLTEDAVERILEAGVMPLVTIKGRDEVKLLRFQSIAEPIGKLQGPWVS